jgi:hypothetical protein
MSHSWNISRLEAEEEEEEETVKLSESLRGTFC